MDEENKVAAEPDEIEIDLEKLRAEYEVLEDQANYVLREIRGKIDNLIEDIEFEERKASGGKLKEKAITFVTCRIKTFNSVCEKIRRNKYQNGLSDLTDFLGFKIVCRNEKTIEVVCSKLKRLFAVGIEKDYISNPKPPKDGGYCGAIHEKLRPECVWHDMKVSIPTEIQVTSLALYTVWELQHDQYKGVDPSVLEEIQRILAVAQQVCDNGSAPQS